MQFHFPLLVTLLASAAVALDGDDLIDSVKKSGSIRSLSAPLNKFAWRAANALARDYAVPPSNLNVVVSGADFMAYGAGCKQLVSVGVIYSGHHFKLIVFPNGCAIEGVYGICKTLPRWCTNTFQGLGQSGCYLSQTDGIRNPIYTCP